MAIRIGETIPNLTLPTDEGTFVLHDWIGDQWAIIFSHPKDFTPVCTTEFGAVAQLAEAFAARNTRVLGLSVDGVEEHKAWKADIEAYAGAPATFPIIADEDLAVSKALDMLPADAYLPDGRTAADSASVRVVFIISRRINQRKHRAAFIAEHVQKTSIIPQHTQTFGGCIKRHSVDHEIEPAMTTRRRRYKVCRIGRQSIGKMHVLMSPVDHPPAVGAEPWRVGIF